MLSNCTVILLYGGGVGGLGFPAPFLPLIEHIRRSYIIGSGNQKMELKIHSPPLFKLLANDPAPEENETLLTLPSKLLSKS
jgi:hypothetical protein